MHSYNIHFSLLSLHCSRLEAAFRLLTTDWVSVHTLFALILESTSRPVYKHNTTVV
ncbi:hypothetical protein PDIG_04990 [Penicillium digitatum PHI26]|uniref:Uncharacterized protein n=2 Tax=Penicillium digitatum TaxID=36651 RepID=K9GCV2_PEND2|nr:hypothetical protein PDIP_09660 [Penicillium digitatum Pd1]EKV19002.1 hypothetical protein PDIG_04990 [Penicillium digitatum PHI26]EKV21140.1 hypothetical protein PDIP_09660 [Penicillium digitatum Pd1]